MNLFGEHIDRLALLASDVERRLAAIEGIEDAKSSVESSRQEIQVSLNQELAANYGVSPETLSQTFAFTLGGRRLRRYNAGDKEVELLLMMSQQDVSTLDDLKSFVVSGEDGRGVTLGTLAEFLVVDKPKTIERENRKTQVSIRGGYEGEDWDGTREQIEESLNGMAFPVGYSWSFGERIQEQDRQLEQMLVNYLLALALIYIVMASQFESLVHPFAILFSIPFVFWGVTWFLLVTNTPLNFMAQIGLLVLMGIVVKNGIVLIDHINNLRREGYDRETAIELGGKERLRPILMTAGTAVLALVPMAIGRTGLRVSFRERSSKYRRHTEGLEERRGDPAKRGDKRSLLAANDEGQSRRPHHRELGERLELGLPLEELRIGDLASLSIRILWPDHKDPLLLGKHPPDDIGVGHAEGSRR